jgi:hypothetical protein
LPLQLRDLIFFIRQALIFPDFDPFAMDIDRFNFWQTLPGVLEAISLSDYVAFDLEMTGISGHPADKALQHTESTAYHAAAEVARTFQILQMGLTCLSYDCKHKGFRPHGIFLAKTLT